MRELTAETSTGAARRRLSILLVEDQDAHAQLFHSLALTALPRFELTRVAALGEAFRRLENSRYDLVVLDLGLPESRGIDTLRRVLERHEDCPVVVLTTSTDLELGEEALRMGALDFLSKDEISRLSLARMLRYALERWEHKRGLMRALSDVEGFALAAAHDLKSPLNTMQNCCQLIEMEIAEGRVTEDTRQVIRSLAEGSRRAARLVDDLLEFAKLGNDGLRPQPVDLRELATGVVESLASLINDVGGLVECGDLPQVYGDPGLLAHVFQNLIANGLKYRSPDRDPVVKVKFASGEDGSIVIYVHDNGLGLRPGEESRIFAPFQRLENAKSVEGSGLGLSICQRIVEAHEGRIWCYSEEGAGATFCFSLPAR